AAADVHADGCRDDRAQGRDHRAHGRTDTQVHVGNRGDVLEDDGQARRVGELLLRFVLHGYAARPHLAGHAAFGLFGVVVLFHVHVTSRNSVTRVDDTLTPRSIAC